MNKRSQKFEKDWNEMIYNKTIERASRKEVARMFFEIGYAYGLCWGKDE